VTFTEIFRLDGNAATHASGVSSTVNASSISVLDSSPPRGGKVFYRLDAVAP